MAKVYFIKHGMVRPLYRNGKIVPFVPIGDDTGFIELDPILNSSLVNTLNGCAGTLGVLAVTEPELAEIKKNSAGKLQRRSLRPDIRISSELQPRAQARPAANAVAPSDPVEIPSAIPKPKRARQSRQTDSLAPIAESAKDVPVSSE